jgi:hypothetical protein
MEKEIKELKQELTMHDTLANKGRYAVRALARPPPSIGPAAPAGLRLNTRERT